MISILILVHSDLDPGGDLHSNSEGQIDEGHLRGNLLHARVRSVCTASTFRGKGSPSSTKKKCTARQQMRQAEMRERDLRADS